MLLSWFKHLLLWRLHFCRRQRRRLLLRGTCYLLLLCNFFYFLFFLLKHFIKPCWSSIIITRWDASWSSNPSPLSPYSLVFSLSSWSSPLSFYFYSYWVNILGISHCLSSILPSCFSSCSLSFSGLMLGA